MQIFVTKRSPLGLKRFFITKVLYLLSPKSPPLGFAVFVTQGFPFELYRPKGPSWDSRFFITQVSPLGFPCFLVTQGSHPPWFWECCCHQGFLLGFGIFFITKGPPLGLEDVLSPKGPSLGFQVFRHPSDSWVSQFFCCPMVQPLGLEDVLSLKGSPLGI